MDRRIIAWALLFSVPPAIGLTGFLTVMLGDGPVNPMGALVGAGLGLVLFLLVVVGAGRGATDIDGEFDTNPPDDADGTDG